MSSTIPSEARTFFTKPRAINDFDAMRVSLASPEKIRSWSHGEVTKPETINYRTFKPERDGLFCARIFGPVTDWECLCGKYKRMKHRGVVCDKCGVEVTRSRVRRERMGHIELAAPVSHVWFFKGLPSRIGQLLDMTMRDLERVLYFEAYVVVDPGDTPLEEKQVLSEEQYREIRAEFGDSFVAKMGAEAIQELLRRLDLDEMAGELRLLMRTEPSVVKRQKAAKRLRVVESFRKSGNRPEWMILEVIPVIPPELRPLVPLDGGRFATSDLNDLYRRVINRNNRLKKLLELRAPEVIVRNEKRMLQEAVDALFDNGRRGRVIKGSNGRPLKSLSDALKGKQGRFRQNLLGKRVDYSGRTVIVVGPELQLHQCGLPKEMALELFKPFIYHELEKRGLVTTIKMARELVEQRPPEVWDALETVIQDHPVMLNRAPTLHRLGIQAFEPVLVEGKAIRIHPLVCAAYNADFDGDQMAVHVPLSPVAQLEARVLMLAPRNILSPASGKPLAVPSQDMVLGIYYLTSAKAVTGKLKTFASLDEVVLAHANGRVSTLQPIEVVYTGNLLDMTVEADQQDILHGEPQWVDSFHLETTVGRVIFNASLPRELPFINAQLKKGGLQSLVYFTYLRYGHAVTVRLLDALKNLGFAWATRAGISIGAEDMVVPVTKEKLIQQAMAEVEDVEKQRASGIITAGERKNRIVDIWHRVTERVSDEMFREMRRRAEEAGELNPIFTMADSGARGSKEQVRQIAGMRGLMSKPSGEIIETPITANFREGLSVLQYFISTHGARKGLADTALKTADSGYLTRRLVDVSQDVIVTEEDCGTDHGIYVTAITEGGEVLEKLRDRLVGRVSAEDIVDPLEGTVICRANQEITEELASAIEDAGHERVKIRSALTCETRRGVCRLCYGRMLATGRLAELGEAVGIIAAQSIGEPGTQLTMRTFHYGGTATRATEQSRHQASRSGIVKLSGVQVVTNTEGKRVVVSRNAKIAVADERGRERERYNLVYGSVLYVHDGDSVEPKTVLAEWDPFTSAVLTTVSGRVEFVDLVEGENVREEVDRLTGHVHKIVIEPLGADKRIPTIVVRSEGEGASERRYQLAIGSHLMVTEGDQVSPGDVLAKIPRETTKTKDITGGLPRVVELFEARRPKDAAVVSEISGVVHIGEASRGTRKVMVEGREGSTREYTIPKYSHLVVQDGEWIQTGESITDGPVDPHDVLAVLGETELQRYLVDKIQEVYRTQGVTINDKHIEVIVRQMCRFVKITDPGDTDFLLDEQVPRYRVLDENERIEKLGGQPARFAPVLLGITKAALATESFISAASFQETTRVLTEAAVSGRVDHLHGLKENVIVGRLIPAGTGLKAYHYFTVEPVPEEEMATADEEDVAGDYQAELARLLPRPFENS